MNNSKKPHITLAINMRIPQTDQSDAKITTREYKIVWASIKNLDQGAQNSYRETDLTRILTFTYDH